MSRAQKEYKLLELSLTEKMSHLGYFIRRDSGKPSGMVFVRVPEKDFYLRGTQGIIVDAEASAEGAATLTGRACILSRHVKETLRSLPATTRLFPSQFEDELRLESLDSEKFGDLPDSEGQSSVFLSDIIEASTWFTRFVSGPVESWYADRTDIEKLAILATTPVHSTSARRHMIDIFRFNGVLIQAIIEERADIAAAMMHWHEVNPGKHSPDSRRRAHEFDRALREIYPTYALERQLRHRRFGTKGAFTLPTGTR
ncbi:hypothetical protein [Nocardia sp. NPDC057668]|uniref:hypothetical protein n=1 Tax=Nocardia sp. NPDC057668 TaxID=3346202 RepID=UPI003672B9A4